MENTELTCLSKKYSVFQRNAIEDNKPLKYELKSVTQTFFYKYMCTLHNEK